LSILCDAEILNALDLKSIKITPFVESHLTPNGYDLSVDRVRLAGSTREEDEAEIQERTQFSVLTKEEVSLGDQICASLWLRSSWARKGVIGSFGKVDAGFAGNLVLSLFNGSSERFTIAKDERLVQIVFERMDRPAARNYSRRSGTYQNQKTLGNI
jgi:dCTP deaminase